MFITVSTQLTIMANMMISSVLHKLFIYLKRSELLQTPLLDQKQTKKNKPTEVSLLGPVYP